MDGSGNVYVADAANNTVRKITSGGVVTTLAGTVGGHGFDRWHRQRRAVQLSIRGGAGRIRQPLRDRRREQYDPQNHRGWGGYDPGWHSRQCRLDSTARAPPHGSTVPAAWRWTRRATYTWAISTTSRSGEFRSAGVVTTLAGQPGVQGDRPTARASAARFDHPSGVAVDATGSLYVADYVNNTIRRGGGSSRLEHGFQRRREVRHPLDAHHDRRPLRVADERHDAKLKRPISATVSTSWQIDGAGRLQR